MSTPRVLVIATSRETRGGITSVVKAHETGDQWAKYHCKWIQTHRDGSTIRKLWYLATSLIEYFALLPFYDIVHIHVGLQASINRKKIFAQIAHLFNKKIIIHFHPSTEKHLFDEHKYNIEKLFSYGDLLLVLSPQWIKWINQAYPNKHFKIQVLYNPCPIVKRDFSKKKKHILFAGMLSDRKGYNRLLEAFSKISRQYPEWKIIFAGNGEIENAKSIQKKLQIAPNQVQYLGWVTGEKKETVFQEASIYCLPSWGEGFPMGVLDALAYGIPIITTPVGGVIDIFKNGVNGLIYQTYNIDELAKDLSLLINSQEIRYSIIREADKLVNNEFNIVKITNQLDKIYSSL